MSRNTDPECQFTVGMHRRLTGVPGYALSRAVGRIGRWRRSRVQISLTNAGILVCGCVAPCLCRVKYAGFIIGDTNQCRAHADMHSFTQRLDICANWA
jgi:hypothetical protein